MEMVISCLVGTEGLGTFLFFFFYFSVLIGWKYFEERCKPDVVLFLLLFLIVLQ